MQKPKFDPEEHERTPTQRTKIDGNYMTAFAIFIQGKKIKTSRIAEGTD